MSAITTTDLTKTFGGVTALHSVDLCINEGEIFGFLGPNGAGKSTMIDILLDFRRPTTGQVSVLGHDPQQEPEKVRRRCGILPDGYGLYSRLTARQHIRFVAEMAEIELDPSPVLARVGLDEYNDRPVSGYSKGMRQRLALGMALIGDPDVLILDEPVSGLDPTGIQKLRKIIREEADRGTTVFFSSHLLDQVDAVCDRVGILNEGRLLAVDTIEALRESTGNNSALILSVDDFLSESVIAGIEELDGITDIEVDGTTLRMECTTPTIKSEVINQISATGSTITDVNVQERSLEQLFNEYTEAGRR